MNQASDEHTIDHIERSVSSWYPWAVLRRTNWLYRVDALRPADVHHLTLLWDHVVIMREYAMQFSVWAESP